MRLKGLACPIVKMAGLIVRVQRVFNVVLRKSITTHIHQLIIYLGNSKGQFDGFVGEVTSARRLEKILV